MPLNVNIIIFALMLNAWYFSHWNVMFCRVLNCLHLFVVENVNSLNLRCLIIMWNLINACDKEWTQSTDQFVCSFHIWWYSLARVANRFELNQSKDAFAYLNGNLFGDCMIFASLFFSLCHYECAQNKLVLLSRAKVYIWFFLRGVIQLWVH